MPRKTTKTDTTTTEGPAARLPARIRERRKALPLTQDDAANRARVTLRTWQRWETGATQGAIAHLADIADALETTPEELLGMDRPARGRAEIALEDRLRAIETTQATILQALTGLQTTLADPDAALREADELLAAEPAEPGTRSAASAPKRKARPKRRSK